MATKIKVGSYSELGTVEVKPFQAYEKDFQNPGQFEVRNHENQIHLRGYLWPGRYDGKQWHQTPPGDESFLIDLYYRNQNNVGIKFSAHVMRGDVFRKAYNFVQRAAKKFFLVNDLVQSSGLSKKDMTWDGMQEIIFIKKSGLAWEEGLIRANTWRKTMTVAEAQELFKYLKLDIQFPK